MNRATRTLLLFCWAVLLMASKCTGEPCRSDEECSTNHCNLNPAKPLSDEERRAGNTGRCGSESDGPEDTGVAEIEWSEWVFVVYNGPQEARRMRFLENLGAFDEAIVEDHRYRWHGGLGDIVDPPGGNLGFMSCSQIAERGVPACIERAEQGYLPSHMIPGGPRTALFGVLAMRHQVDDPMQVQLHCIPSEGPISVTVDNGNRRARFDFSENGRVISQQSAMCRESRLLGSPNAWRVWEWDQWLAN